LIYLLKDALAFKCAFDLQITNKCYDEWDLWYAAGSCSSFTGFEWECELKLKLGIGNGNGNGNIETSLVLVGLVGYARKMPTKR